MPKDEWGVKRVCPTTGKRFYDLNKTPIVSPYTGETVELSRNKSRMIAADAEDAASVKAKSLEETEEDDIILDRFGSTELCALVGVLLHVLYDGITSVAGTYCVLI